MIEWTDISDRDSALFDGAFSDEPRVSDALRHMLDFVSTRLVGSGNAQSFSLLLPEVGLDTGRLILAATTRDAHAAGRADGCSIRLQSLQDAWYHADDAGLTADAFADAISNHVRDVGSLFLEILADLLPVILEGASTDGFTFTLYGGVPGVSLLDHYFPRFSGG